MLGTWLYWLTAAATVLLVPALVALLRVDRHAHKALPRGVERRVGLVAATTLVAVSATAVATLLGAGSLGALLVAAVLGGSVLASAPGRDGWAVRGLVTWGLLLAGTVAALLWFGAWVFDPSTAGGLDSRLVGGLWGMAAWSAVRLRRPVESWLAARAGLDDPAAVGTPGDDKGEDTVGLVPVGPVPAEAATGGPAGDDPTAGSRRGAVLRRTGMAVAALVVPAAAFGALDAGGDAPKPESPASRAGSDDAGGPGSASSTGTKGGPSPSVSGAAGSPTRTAHDPAPTGTLSGDATPQQGTETPTLPSPTVTAGTELPSESPSPTAGGGFPTVLPLPTEWPEQSKTPGYAKEKPNRPSDAPSPGGGQG